MSILINGMDMPRKCSSCDLVRVILEEGYFDCALYPQISWRYLEDIPDFVTKNCPLVEIPTPHGRLIDADQFLAILQDIKSKCIYDREAYIVNLIAEELEKAPTIIEAEGENDKL